MRLSGKIVGANIDFKTGKPCLTLGVNERRDFENLVDEMRNKDKLSIEVKPFRERRSLDANAYFWTLADKLSATINKSKEEVYREYIKDVGGNNEVVCVKNTAVERLCEGWGQNGYRLGNRYVSEQDFGLYERDTVLRLFNLRHSADVEAHRFDYSGL